MKRIFEKLKRHKDNNIGADDMNRRYEALTPTNNIANGKEYMAAIDWALAQEDVHNIAIAGPYGSGKSSVIETYLIKQKRKDILRISLAAFNLEAMFKENSNHIDDEKLEAGILKQLFYSVDGNKIPQSRYRRIQSEPCWSNPLVAMIVMVILCTLAYYVSPDKVSNFINDIYSLPLGCAIAVFIGLICLVWYSFTKFAGWFRKNGNILEIKIFDKATVKNEKGNDESVFNKNMDEIVYYFERTKTELVIIEDLDRFESTNIFVALRELNNILNNYEKINGRVKFIYAIKDDMFKKEGERTKFFDFIIPIVPYISSTNSGEILRDRLKFDEKENQSRIYDISGRFISMISPYISDMRDLACICNEFNVFKNTLKGNQELDLNDEKMFALIVFKNLYPKDFAELEDELSTSIVLTAFANKKNFIERKEELIEAKKTIENEKINAINKEALYSIRELKLALLGCITKYEFAIYNIKCGNNLYPFSQIIEDEFDINQLKGKRFICHYYNSGTNYITIDNIEETVKQNGGNYFERIEKVKKGLEACKEESRRVVEQYEQRINGLRAHSMKQIIEEFDTKFLDETVRKNNLLVFLLRHGYLDENYKNYINYFHPNSITKEEMNFILGVRNHRSEAGYSYTLKNLEQIFGRLQDFEFKQKETLNYDLVDYVLSEQEKTSSADMLIEQLTDHSDESMAFIKVYIERGENIDILIPRLCSRNQLFWRDITQDDGIPIETRYRYLVLMLKYADIKDIVKQDIVDNEDSGILTLFLISYADSLKNISDAPVDKQIELIEELGVVFADVETDSIDEAIREEIFENCRYELNAHMIRRLFEWKAPDQVEEQSKRNYSLIMKLGYQNLLDYVHDNFVDYISNVVVGVETNINEEKSAVEDILVRLLPENLELCFAVLDEEPVIWDNINDCWADATDEMADSKRKVWNYLLEHERIECTWYNFAAYYAVYGSDEAWEKYFDKHIDILLEDTENPAITEDVLDQLLYAEMSDENFKKYVSGVKLKPYNGKIKELSENKISIMIKEAVLPYTNAFWEEMGNVFPDLRIPYAEANKNFFMEALDEITLTEEEINQLLGSAEFSQDDKKNIMEKLDDETLSVESAMAIRALDFMVKKSYADAAWAVLDEENKYELLLHQMDNYKDDELSQMFLQLADVYHPLAERKNHKVRLEHEDYNRRLLAKLQERGYITSYQEEWENQSESEKKQVYTARVRQEKS